MSKVKYEFTKKGMKLGFREKGKKAKLISTNEELNKLPEKELTRLLHSKTIRILEVDKKIESKK
jgi:hypothetical protein